MRQTVETNRVGDLADRPVALSQEAGSVIQTNTANELSRRLAHQLPQPRVEVAAAQTKLASQNERVEIGILKMIVNDAYSPFQ